MSDTKSISFRKASVASREGSEDTQPTIGQARGTHRVRYNARTGARVTGRNDALAPTETDRRSRPTGTIRAETLQQADNAKRKNYNGSKYATELYEAMHGGLWGVGTDEDRLFKALDGKTPDRSNRSRSTTEITMAGISTRILGASRATSLRDERSGH